VFVVGAAVAGLQAIATARRLGAHVVATDVRPEVKEQIESVGAKYVGIELKEEASAGGGYAKELSEEDKARQRELLAEQIAQADVVITTALIPGRPAPKLISEATVKSMKPGAVIVDLAVEQGGNVEGIERGRIVVKHGIKMIGLENLPATVPGDASALYSRNVYNFLALMLDPKSGDFRLDKSDDLVGPTLACEAGAVVKKG
jgi:NAD(P) transhydrogenase subunit alpha